MERLPVHLLVVLSCAARLLCLLICSWCGS